MILFSIIVKMQAENEFILPASHGRLLHAAFLNYIRSVDSDFAQKMHDYTSKMFSLGMLQLQYVPKNGQFYIRKGDIIYWRIGCIGEVLMNIIGKLSKGYIFRVGKGNLKVVDVSFDDTVSKVVTFEELCAMGENMNHAERLAIEFKSATTFRYYDYDYPFPKPELVFGSLAEQWNKYSVSTVFDVEKVKNIACMYLIPDNWHGETKRIDFGKNRSLTGFTGKFTYRLNLLPYEYRAIFITLAYFAYFVGIGRLNAQGCGQIDILQIR